LISLNLATDLRFF